MKHAYKVMLPIFLAGTLFLTGCGATNSDTGDTTQNVTQEQTTELDETVTDNQEYFSERDLSGEVDTTEATYITLDGTTVTISEEGTYILSGTIEDGSIIVDAKEDAKIQLVLDGVSINSSDFAAIYVVQADKVFVTLAEGSENTLTNGGTFTQIDDNNVDAVIFSKCDLTLNGSGSLTIESPLGHGIVGKDDVVITGGTYTITAAENAIRANDGIAIANGTFTINAGNDGIHAENNDDDSLGYVYILDGTFDIIAGDDGIHGTTTLVVDGGTINIEAVEGMEATNITINDGEISIEASDDGINASSKSSQYSVKVTINGGYITIVMGEGDTDGVDANGDIEINGGTIDVTGNSTFDYDNTGVINGGTVIVNGEEVTELPEQMMGGAPGGMGGQGGFPGGTGGTPDGTGGGPDGTGGAPDGTGGFPGGTGGTPGETGETGVIPEETSEIQEGTLGGN